MSHISYVGRLMSLQGLEKFVVEKKHGHEIHQLENLNQIRGRMCITGLENVTSIDDAVKANIPSKNHLEALEFQWSSDERVVDDFGLLDALKPHPNIRGLTINWFGGSRFPNWITGQNSLKHLTELQLIRCTSVKELPLLPPNLTGLFLNHIPHLSYFSENDLLMMEERKQFMIEALNQVTTYMKSRYMLLLPSSVGSTIMRFLTFMTEKFEAPDIFIPVGAIKIDSKNDYYFEVELLISWELYMRFQLETMLNKNVESKLVLPSSLTRLWISECSITNDALSTCIQSLVLLSELQLVEIQTLTSLPPEEVLCALQNLRSLYIEDCYLLSSLGGIRVLTSLRELSLKCCFNWDSSNEKLPASLEILKFQECVYADATVNEILYMGNLGENRRERVLHVGHLSGLRELAIMGWEGLLEGLDSLTSLWWLTVTSYPGFDLSPSINKCSMRIENVLVDDPKLLKKMLSDETISSIEYLSIVDFEGDSIDDEVFQFLPSLKHLDLNNCNITHLPMNWINLASLRTIKLDNCPNLHEMILPKNIRELRIKDCPILSENFKNAGSCRVWFDQGTTTVTFPTKAQFAEAGPSGMANEECY
ncbi:hypothetical protein LUZ63_016671 [Rhynchospora breviuscula]|uniref:R13L1/DRL21-like LRR repeat region domain-containing protein n=1 Tax=Rhynchospora breviuscula TaxID=2022672 RepID=A0A9P9ZC88_9POAL|nr:hypothetical protein LUZ63_016671 [Rhynchospora breviuscula]